MTTSMPGRDIYLRHTDTAGHSWVQQHRVWDIDRFVTAQKTAAAGVNRDAVAKDPTAPALAKVEQITNEQYHSERKS